MLWILKNTSVIPIEIQSINCSSLENFFETSSNVDETESGAKSLCSQKSHLNELRVRCVLKKSHLLVSDCIWSEEVSNFKRKRSP